MELEFSQVLSSFIETFLIACATAFAPLAVAWIIGRVRLTWASIRSEHVAEAYVLEELAAMAVKAAEQAKVAQLIEDKKAYALSVMESWLEQRGYSINLHAISAAIEAAVYDEFTKPGGGA
jgi:hypothetical protein